MNWYTDCRADGGAADYIATLWKYQRSVGQITLAKPELLPNPKRLAPLRNLLRECWQTTLDLVAETGGNQVRRTVRLVATAVNGSSGQ